MDGLTAQMAEAKKSGKPTVDSLSDDLDVAKAQLQLDSDELNDASDDLARVSGDKRGAIQQELTAHQAAMKKYDEQANGGGQTAVVSAKRYGTLAGRINAWFDQRSRRDLLEEAKAKADSDAAALVTQQAEITKRSAAASVQMHNAKDAADASVKGTVARMAQAHSLAQIHSILDDRLQTQRQLGGVCQTGGWHSCRRSTRLWCI